MQVNVPGSEAAGKGLKAIDPARYGSLVHPGDGYSYDIFTQVARAVRAVRSGGHGEAEIERLLAPKGPLSALTGRLGRRITAPWQMYPLGLLFGLGFDTATEVALLVLAGGAALSGLPFYAILCLPILFAAGMSLLDTLDGVFMRFAYGWSFAKPVRRIYCNLTVTGLSVVVALLIGTVELLSVLAEKLGLEGGIWSFVATLDLNVVGYVVVGLFVVTWTVAVAVWRFARVEQRWDARLGRASG